MPTTSYWWKSERPTSLPAIVAENARRLPDQTVAQRRTGSEWSDVTAADLLEQVDALAAGLVSAGIEPGDRVALMAKTRYEWTLLDMAILSAGAVVVPVYESSSESQLAWIFEDSGAVAAVVETPGHAAMAQGLRAAHPHVRHVWAIEETPDLADVGSLDDLRAAGDETTREQVRERRDRLQPGDLATLLYTSGTTGRPKGCRLTHDNFLSEIINAIDDLPELFDADNPSTLLFLPLAHVFGRMIQMAVLLKAVRVGHTDIGRITRDLPTFKPAFVLAVPRVFERIYDGAQRKAAANGKEKVFDAATRTAIDYSKALDKGRPGPLLRVRHALFDRLVYSKVKAAFGGDLAWAVSGGAALGERLGHYFRGIGVNVLEGYGLTETTAACTVNTRAAQRIGTVGRALPSFEVAISDDGEVLVRGGHVFDGYWNNPEATAEAMVDGWFRTGDLGRVDDGYLTITGRAKEIIVTSGGKNVSPGPMEDIVRSHRLVSQAMVVGDNRNFIAALLTIDPESFADWVAEHERSGLTVEQAATDPALLAELQTAVDEANATVSHAEQIKKFTVLPIDFTEASGHLTPTLKLKRNVVNRDFAREVDALYAHKRG